MTNAQIYQAKAVAALENGQLKGKAADFINQIKDYSKKQLNNLSSAQFKFLRSICESL